MTGPLQGATLAELARNLPGVAQRLRAAQPGDQPSAEAGHVLADALAAHQQGYVTGYNAGYADGEREGATSQRRYGRFAAFVWGAAITASVMGAVVFGRS